MIFRTPTLPDAFLQVIEKIDDLRKKLEYSTSDNLNRWHGYLARMAFARLIYSSNSMEGVNATLEDAVAAVDGADSPHPENVDDWKAVMGHREAMDYIIQLSKEPGFPYNAGTLLGLHFMMMKYDLSKNPGRFRPGAVHVTNMASGEPVYEGPPAADVPGLMNELVTDLNHSRDTHVITRAAMAHLNLTMIHPFKDGNGRMARALQTLVLARDGILDPRFSSIEEYIGRNSAAYYAVLEEVGQGSWQPQRDALPWIKFNLRAHFDQAQRLLRRAEEADALWSRLEAFIAQHHLLDRTLHALSRAASGGTILSAVYRQEAQVSGQVAKRDLKLLVEQGLLLAIGERRGRSYVASPSLRKIGEELRIKRPIPDPFEVAAGPGTQ